MNLSAAIEFATAALAEKVDDKGSPYINHALRVMERMDTEEEKMAAVLHDVVEDSDGDLWFATSNGISFYQTDTKEWRSFFSSFDPVPNDENHIF